MSAPLIFFVMGIITILAVIYIISVIPEYFVRFCIWLLTNSVYRIKIIGDEHVPYRGPALLIANHVTFLDSFFIGATIQRFVRFLMHHDYYKLPVMNRFFKLMFAIDIYPEAGHESVAKSLQKAKEELKAGHVVCIFPEGKLTRDGNLNEFRPGFETVMKDMNCPIIPIYMHNVWGSIFSWEGGRVLKKWPKKIPYPITVEYGKPLPAQTKAAQAEAVIRAMGDNY
jgi:acyl-[acyl-carrier-protein]-phospholipid O-acyltransferase/long-chain-fatty-acid--[acyl-carrier-protein] ligase